MRKQAHHEHLPDFGRPWRFGINGDSKDSSSSLQEVSAAAVAAAAEGAEEPAYQQHQQRQQQQQQANMMPPLTGDAPPATSQATDAVHMAAATEVAGAKKGAAELARCCHCGSHRMSSWWGRHPSTGARLCNTCRLYM